MYGEERKFPVTTHTHTHTYSNNYILYMYIVIHSNNHKVCLRHTLVRVDMNDGHRREKLTRERGTA